jgi:arginase
MVIRFILTPFFLDQPLPGLDELQGADYVVNKPVLPGGNPQSRMVALYKPLAQLVETAARSGDVPVSLAGDCCTSIGVLAGLQQAGIDPTLVWFDAHGDFNTWETTPSGFLGGMPLAMLVGRGEQTIMQGVGTEVLAEKQVILSDARDLDPGEREAIAGSQISHLKQVGELLDYDLPPGTLWVHFDTDVIDAEEAPAMNYPTPNGPSASALGDVFSHLAGSGQIAAISVSSWNPELDLDGHSQEVAMGLVARLLLE